MPRRAKLLITALFLVLSGIVVVDAVRTWCMENPLRCTIDPQRDIITLENTSGVPVIVYSAHITDSRPGDRCQNITGFLFARGSSPTDGNNKVIPPGGTILCPVRALSKHASVRAKDAKVRYSWGTRTRHYYEELCRRVYKAVPESWQSLVPYPDTKAGYAPLFKEADTP